MGRLYDYGLLINSVLCIWALVGLLFMLSGVRAIVRKRMQRSFRSGTFYFGRRAVVGGVVHVAAGLVALAAVARMFIFP